MHGGELYHASVRVCRWIGYRVRGRQSREAAGSAARLECMTSWHGRPSTVALLGAEGDALRLKPRAEKEQSLLLGLSNTRVWAIHKL